MSTVQPFSRVTGSRSEVNVPPDASLPPHMQHLRPKRRERPTERQRARKAAAVGEARRNETVEFVRSLQTPARKRGGARYGPAPAEPPHEGMRAPEPMSSERRVNAYLRQNGFPSMTLRQMRQFVDMAERHDEAVGRAGRKGRPTPKRGEIR